jgi:hypothetical protein
MDITLTEDEKKLILWLVGQITIKAVDVEAVSIAMAAQSLLAKLQLAPDLELVTDSEAPECVPVSA